jgi:hypothetical protein
MGVAKDHISFALQKHRVSSTGVFVGMPERNRLPLAKNRGTNYLSQTPEGLDPASKQAIGEAHDPEGMRHDDDYGRAAARSLARWWWIVLLVVGGGGVFTPAPVTGADASPKALKILVPLKQGFTEFVRWSSNESIPTNATLQFSGFSIDVFKRCAEKLPYDLDYTFVGYDNGAVAPIYDNLLDAFVDSEVYKSRWVSNPQSALLPLAFSFVYSSIIC